MGFTVLKLFKLLAKEIDRGHGRKKVFVAKHTFVHPCEDDGATILEVEGLGIACIGNIDGDGGTKYRKNGTESTSTVCVLAGGNGADADGRLIDSECFGATNRVAISRGKYSPFYDALVAITKSVPPIPMRGLYSSKELTDEEFELVQNWASDKAPIHWATGLSIIDCADLMVKSALENSSIPKQGEADGVD